VRKRETERQRETEGETERESERERERERKIERDSEKQSEWREREREREEREWRETVCVCVREGGEGRERVFSTRVPHPCNHCCTLIACINAHMKRDLHTYEKRPTYK